MEKLVKKNSNPVSTEINFNNNVETKEDGVKLQVGATAN